MGVGERDQGSGQAPLKGHSRLEGSQDKRWGWAGTGTNALFSLSSEASWRRLVGQLCKPPTCPPHAMQPAPGAAPRNGAERVLRHRLCRGWSSRTTRAPRERPWDPEALKLKPAVTDKCTSTSIKSPHAWKTGKWPDGDVSPDIHDARQPKAQGPSESHARVLAQKSQGRPCKTA